MPGSDSAPDIWGLPEYKVSKMMAEIDGDGHDVRAVFGSMRFGQINWLYTVICSPEDLILLAQECERIAEEAFSLRAAIRERRLESAH